MHRIPSSPAPNPVLLSAPSSLRKSISIRTVPPHLAHLYSTRLTASTTPSLLTSSTTVVLESSTLTTETVDMSSDPSKKTSALMNVWSDYRSALKRQYEVQAAMRSPEQPSVIASSDESGYPLRPSDLDSDTSPIHHHHQHPYQHPSQYQSQFHYQHQGQTMATSGSPTLSSWNELLNPREPVPAPSTFTSSTVVGSNRSATAHLQVQRNSPPPRANPPAAGRPSVTITSPLADTRMGQYSTPSELVSRPSRPSKADDLQEDFSLSEIVRMRGKLLSLNAHDWVALPVEYRKELLALSEVIQRKR